MGAGTRAINQMVKGDTALPYVPPREDQQVPCTRPVVTLLRATVYTCQVMMLDDAPTANTKSTPSMLASWVA